MKTFKVFKNGYYPKESEINRFIESYNLKGITTCFEFEENKEPILMYIKTENYSESDLDKLNIEWEFLDCYEFSEKIVKSLY